MKAGVPTDPHDARGFFKTRLVRGGAWVACRIWTEEDRDPETGDLLADIVYRAEIDGREVEWRDGALRGWPWTPIDEAEYRYLLANADWERQYQPAGPAANPTRPAREAAASASLF